MDSEGDHSTIGFDFDFDALTLHSGLISQKLTLVTLKIGT
jgi:hypothetical protein